MTDCVKGMTFKIGVMHKILVYDNGAIIGYGYVTINHKGDMSNPDLYDIKGMRLPEGWYTLKITEENFLVNIPDRIQ